jgi:hypothetical protein
MIAIVGENYPTGAGSGKRDFAARRAPRPAESQFIRPSRLDPRNEGALVRRQMTANVRWGRNERVFSGGRDDIAPRAHRRGAKRAMRSGARFAAW